MLAMMKMSEAWWYAGMITGMVVTHLVGPYFGFAPRTWPLYVIGLVLGLGLSAMFEALARSGTPSPRGPSDEDMKPGDGPGAPRPRDPTDPGAGPRDPGGPTS